MTEHERNDWATFCQAEDIDHAYAENIATLEGVTSADELYKLIKNDARFEK
jgi:hypothetical protein